jgi:pilus assembly protein FimV
MRLRPDSRLSINQTMIAIFEANPEAFAGNINRLKAGVTLRIPSADDVFQISRGDALSAVKQMNDEWRGGAVTADTGVDDTAYEDTSTADTGYESTYDTSAEEPAEPETETSLVLVPPDEEPAAGIYDETVDSTEMPTREQEIVDRISALEAADVPNQQSLIEIRDNELAELRQELAEIRGEVYEPPAEDLAADDEIQAEDDTLAPDTAEDAVADAEAAAEEAEAEQPTPANVVRTTRVSEPGIMDRIVGMLGSIWTKIIAALLVVAGILLWFVRRGRGDEDDGSWETLDRDEIVEGAMSATETLQAPRPDESFVVVEQDSGIRPLDDETIESPAPEMQADATGTAETGRFDSLEDTFSSETAVNLDQTDPIAEADFHMAYGLYDQAADLINGALESDPNDKALMSKLCEIYFVWGNRDAFIDSASNLKGAVGDDDSAEWDKIVIMGQQIAADHELFAGAAVAGATKAVDLSFESEMEDAGALDMDFGAESSGESEILDLGASGEAEDDTGLDFLFDDDDATTEAATEEMTREEPTAQMIPEEPTAEMPVPDEPTVETPTIEDQFLGLEGTSELPSIDDSVGTAIADSGQDSEQTAEINLDELDLDVDGLDETELASLDDLDVTGTNEVLEDPAEITGKNPEIDPDATGVQETLDPDATTGLQDVFDPDETGMRPALEPDAADFGDVMDELDDAGATGLRLAPDETGRMPTLDAIDETDLLDATGKTQVLSEDLAVETGASFDDDDVETLLASFDDEDETTAIADDAETLLASLDDDEATEVSGDAETLLAPLDDEEDYDFAKTEALPSNAFSSDVHSDETSEMPAVAGTDMDLDLDDLTAALQISGGGDTVEQLRDDATVEQPRPSIGDETTEVPTMSIGPDDMSDDLHEARTMTEVGTKLDLARAYVDMGDPAGARSILEEVLDEGDEGQRQQAQQLLDSLPG